MTTRRGRRGRYAAPKPPRHTIRHMLAGVAMTLAALVTIGACTSEPAGVMLYEDGSYVTPNGTTGCVAHAPCDD